MALVKGFTDKVYLYEGSALVELPTIGDITYGSSRTDIAVKTRASDKVRTIPGMKSMPISFTVIAGTDPEDQTATNAYDKLQTAYENQTPVKMKFGDVEDTFSILSFETSSPVDDLKTASVSVAPSALGSSGSGSGT